MITYFEGSAGVAFVCDPHSHLHLKSGAVVGRARHTHDSSGKIIIGVDLSFM